MAKGKIIAATRNMEAFSEACMSRVGIIFDLAPSIEDIEDKVQLCREKEKLLFIHIDLAEGIGKDKAGLKYAKQAGVDGIISTRPALIKLANEVGLKTVQRIFLLDTQSVDSAATMLKSKPNMAEVMPGVVPGRVIEKICAEAGVSVIAGGLIATEEEVNLAISAGAVAVSTGKKELWNI